MSTLSEPRAGWWDDFYDDLYADMVLVGEPSHTKATIEKLSALIGLEQPSLIFDQCCGVGRWGLELAAQGHQVVGVDIIPRYIERAQQRAQAARTHERCTFVVEDARAYIPPSPCDVAINWHTSFGYSEQDQDNAKMLERAFDALKPGGTFAMECGNMARIISTFQPTISYRHAHEDGTMTLILRESSLELERGLLSQLWTFIKPDGQIIERPSSIKMYLPHELKRMVTQAGFEQVQCYGDLDGQAIQLNSPRCIVTARRPTL